ncbi:unnamed protein product [Prorocentrum cordatum]|uniref:Polynucleotide adenylyltransferase n=1 Tax=Prorocentrum cordatum TaxID=2364126 RepID=A0ABN9VT46_9DINO|nr:unnamed protein product [Polarella glacialis]
MPCSLPCVELLRRFFSFYHCGFRRGGEVVSVRLGRRRNAAWPQLARLRGRHVPRLHIEDPFILERNLNCVLGGRRPSFGRPLRRPLASSAPEGSQSGSARVHPGGSGSAAGAPGRRTTRSSPRRCRCKARRTDHQGPAPSTLSRTTASTRSDRSRSPDGGSLKLATEVVDGHQGAASSMAHTSAAGAGTRDLLHQALPPSLPSQRSLPVTAARASVRGGGGRAVAPGAFRQSPPPQSQDPPGFAAAAAAEPAGGKPAWQPNPDAPVFVPAPTDQDRCYSDGSPACDEDRSKGGAQLAAWRLARTPPARTAARPRASPAAVHSAPPKASVKPPGTFRPPVVAPAPSAAPSPPPATCPALPPLGSAAAPPTAASDRGLRLPAAPGTLPAPPPVEAHGAPASAGGYCTAAVAVAPAVALAVVLVAGAIAGVPDHLVQLGSAPAHAAALARSLSVDVELLRASAPGLLTIAAQGCHSAAVAGLQPECGAARSAPPMAEEGEAGDSETSLADHGHWFL